MAWVLRLVNISAEGDERCADVMEISRSDTLADLASLGLTLDEGRQLLSGMQQEIVAKRRATVGDDGGLGDGGPSTHPSR